METSRDTIKTNVNNAYLHPNKFCGEQIDEILQNTDFCHKECLKFEKKYNRYILDFNLKYSEIKQATTQEEEFGFFSFMQMKFDSARSNKTETYSAFGGPKVSVGEIS